MTWKRLCRIPWENSFFPYFTYTLLPYEEGLTADYTVSF